MIRLFHKTLYRKMSRSKRGRFVVEFINAAGLNGNLDTVKNCVERGIDVEAAKGEDAWRAIHSACSYGHLEIVQYLVENCRANIVAREREGWTPLHLACQFGHLDIVQYITRDRRIKVHTTTANDGTTALHVACQNGHLKVAQYLVEECGVDATVTTKCGETPMTMARDHGKQHVVDYLSKISADSGLSKFVSVEALRPPMPHFPIATETQKEK